jgi:succinyl-CoA synthetase beta subunit
LHKYRIPIPLGNAAFDSKEAFLVAKQFGQQKKMRYVVKAQVLTGGRGKGHFKENKFQSGVHIVNTPEEVKDISEKMLKQTLVTK